MKPSKPLDEWQIQFIKYFKSKQPQTLDVCLSIWRERCLLPKDYDLAGCLQYMVGDLLEVLFSMYEEDTHRSIGCRVRELIADVHPDQQWKVRSGPDLNQKFLAEGHHYWVNWLWVIADRLRLTEVKYLTDFPSDLSPKSK